MEQYKDFWHRAHRLEPAHGAYLAGAPAPIHLVTNEDMCLYLNWMCWRFSAYQHLNTFLMVGCAGSRGRGIVATIQESDVR